MSNYEFWDELGKIFEAVVAYQEKSVEFNKRFIHPWIRLGNVFDKQDRNTEAIRAYERAIELDPANAQNWYELGNIHFQMKSYEAAAQAYERAIQLAPESGWPYSNLALTLATQGKFVEAVPLYQKGIELLESNRDRAMAWNRLGNAYRKLDEYELALQAFQKADELDEENSGFRDELDEIPDGPSLVEGVASETNGSETELIVEPVVLSLAETVLPKESPFVTEMVAPEAPADQNDIVEAVADALETVVETAAEDTRPIQPHAPAPAAETQVEVKVEVKVDVEALAEDVPPPADELQVEEPVPAWVTAETPVEITDSEPETALALVEPAAVEETVAAESVVETAVTVVAETAAVQVTQSVEAQVVVDVAAVAEAVHVALEAETTTAISADSEIVVETQTVVEEVAIVDPEKSFDEIVVTSEDAAPEETPAALPEAAEAEAESTEPAGVHEAYDEYLKDNPELVTLDGADKDEDAAIEAASPTAQEPVAQIEPSGDVRIEMDAKNAHVWNELGNVYFGTGAYDDAIAAYTKAIELDRWFAWPYSNLALAYMQKGRFAEATLLYQRSIELFTSEKDKAISWNRLGNVYRRLNDYDNAIAAYQRADELDPDNATLSLQSRFSLLGSFSVEPKQKPSYAL